MPQPARKLKGMRFGGLLVLNRAEGKNKRNAYWLCQCDCGNTVIATSTQLTSGKRVSCGCLNKTTAVDLKGKRFGRLVAIERGFNTKHGKTTWKCLCDCGNEIVISTDNLGKSANSCGCARREKHRIDCAGGTRIRNLTQRKPRMELIKDSGIKGVAWDSRREKWAAYITFKGNKRHLGYHDEIPAAAEARKGAEEDLYDPVIEDYKKSERE